MATAGALPAAANAEMAVAYQTNGLTNFQIQQQQAQNGMTGMEHPDLIQGSPMTRHSYVNQAVNFSPVANRYSVSSPAHRQIIRPTPHRLNPAGSAGSVHHLESDQLYPEDHYSNAYNGYLADPGGYFNPLEGIQVHIFIKIQG